MFAVYVKNLHVHDIKRQTKLPLTPLPALQMIGFKYTNSPTVGNLNQSFREGLCVMTKAEVFLGQKLLKQRLCCMVHAVRGQREGKNGTGANIYI